METALTGSRAGEGAAARLSIVRGGPDLAAGGPTKRTERGGRRDGQWEGEALTGRTSGSPTSRRPVTGARSFAPRKGTVRRCSVFCPSHRGVGSFAGRWRAGIETVSVGTPNRVRETTQNMATSMPSVVAACAAMGYPMCLSGYLDPYPVLFHGVSLCLNNSLTHSHPGLTTAARPPGDAPA